jgi:glycosyltransferase involved in cell wall biosynthesis
MLKPLATNVGFSVIICTRNRRDSLQQTVECVLSRLENFPGAKLVIVDNGSTDSTAEYVKQIASCDERIIPLHEPKPGLFFARVQGLLNSAGDFFFLVDDDVLPHDNWPGAVIEELLRDPEIGLLGTAVDALWVSPPPPWFSERLSRHVLTLNPTGRTVCRYPRYPMGASMAGRRIQEIIDLYASAERSKLPLGWGAGSKFGDIGGEDWDLAELYIRNCFTAVVIDHVRANHVVLAHKVTPAWIYKKFQSDGRLRIRYGRLAQLPAFDWPTILQMLAFPAMWLCSGLNRLFSFNTRRTITMTAYTLRVQGMWEELLWGPRTVPLPFHAGKTNISPVRQATRFDVRLERHDADVEDQ